jgi:hypothetical protein
MFDQLSAEILASLIKGFLTTTRTTTTTTTKQNVDPAVHFVYSRVKIFYSAYFIYCPKWHYQDGHQQVGHRQAEDQVVGHTLQISFQDNGGYDKYVA